MTTLAEPMPLSVAAEPCSDAAAAAARYLERRARFSRLLAGILLVPATPIIALLVLLVRLTSPGPGIYRQQRVGKDGREFPILKLRTMRRDAESGTGAVWSAGKRDARVTPVGKWLRLLHLDELPQLLNIVRGEMDFIGPRPERLEIIERDCLVENVENYIERHRVLPGITGLAQINLPPDETIDCVRRKVVLDLEYLESACLSLDLRIMTCTALRMIGIRHGRAVNWLGLARSVKLPHSAPRATKTGSGAIKVRVSQPQPEPALALAAAPGAAIPTRERRERRVAEPAGPRRPR